MLNLLKKNHFFYLKFNNILFKKGKKFNTERILNNFFVFSKKNKMFYSNSSLLNRLFLKKIPFGHSKQKRFGKNYKNIPFFFTLSRGYKEIVKNILSVNSVSSKSKKVSSSIIFKRFIRSLSLYNHKSNFSNNTKEIKFLKDHFNSLRFSKFNYRLQW